jgi:hypothetical protein
MTSPLWSTDHPDPWHRALEVYRAVIRAQGVASLAAHDDWYLDQLPAAIAARTPRHVTHDELVRVTEWKMARGVWRQRNLVLVRGNAADDVVTISTQALGGAADPVRTLATLAGVGPATASAVVAASVPDWPFFDELVAAQVPGLGPVAFTPAYYRRYAAALRQRAGELGDGWTPVMVERALWAAVGGKAQVVP